MHSLFTISRSNMKLVLILGSSPLSINILRNFSLNSRHKTTIMNWETVTTDLEQKVFALWNNGRKLLTMVSNSNSNFVRLECGGEKRHFQIRYEGFLRNRMVMRNEYGVRIAQVKTENKQHFVELNDQRYYFSLTGEGESRLAIYDESMEKPMAVCEMEVTKDKSVLRSVKKTAMHQSLLMALCWYLFVSVSKEIPTELV